MKEIRSVKAFQTILSAELQKRQMKNSKFSLRAFARFLDMSPAHLSKLISGKKNLSKSSAQKMMSKLDLCDFEKEGLIQELIPKAAIKNPAKADLQVLANDEFKLISDWYHFAILSLAQIQNKSDSRWISERLGIEPRLAAEAFHRLQRLGLIKVKNGKFQPTTKELTTTTDIPSQAIRNYHLQNLKLASEKLTSEDVKLREFSSITMILNPSKIPKAKKLINEFKHKLCAEMEAEPLPSEVYTLALQFFPVTKASDRI